MKVIIHNMKVIISHNELLDLLKDRLQEEREEGKIPDNLLIRSVHFNPTISENITIDFEEI